MQQKEATEKKAKFLKLPRISPASRLILFIGVFLIIAIPLFLIYSQQQTRQAELNHQYSILQKVVINQDSPGVLKTDMEAEISIAKNLLDTTKAILPSSDQIAEIIDGLIGLAKENGVEITKTLVANSRNTISIGTDVLEYPVVVIDITLRGQVPKFQNFLLALNSKYPTSELSKVSFTIPQIENELDTANIALTVYCSDTPKSAGGEIPIAGKKAVITVTDNKDLTTETFKIKSSKWRIDWKAAVTDSKWSGFSVIVYRKGETLRYVENIAHIDGSTEGTDYVYEGTGDFYIKVITANISSWEIKIYE